MKILLLSDTHSHIDERMISYAQSVDEIWHCGDFGSMEVIETLQKIKPLRGVYGNIDGGDIRSLFPEILHFHCEGVGVLMVHIGGYPKKYSAVAKREIDRCKPQLFISGHSHILKAMHDKDKELLHLNAGAAGKIGWHKMRTMMRFSIEGKEIKNLEIIELGTK